MVTFIVMEDQSLSLRLNLSYVLAVLQILYFEELFLLSEEYRPSSIWAQPHMMDELLVLEAVIISYPLARVDVNYSSASLAVIIVEN
jgi:hypothetical protein